MAETDSEFSSDSPIQTEAEDCLNRAAFSHRVADVLANHPPGPGLVVGVHAPWGDGKTSVLNLIRTRLAEEPSTEVVEFNPWRFTAEERMLAGFFGSLATAARLKLKSKRVAKLFEELCRVGSVVDSRIGRFGTWVSRLTNRPLEDLRKKLGNALSDSETTFVVLIDDIDRLDVDETHMLFRLVKACTALPNVCYVMAFDDVAVGSALGTKFAGGSAKQAGRDFLEKIIQIPLYLPVAAIADLRSLCFERIDEALMAANLELPSQAFGEFVLTFDRYVVNQVGNPRDAKRYGNAIRFALPMLRGEANVVDILLLEAVRVFYPRVYRVMREHYADFMGIESESLTPRREKSGSAAAKRLESEIGSFGEEGRQAVAGLVCRLFPRLAGVFQNRMYAGSGLAAEWRREKRVCSPDYCERFFTYSISDRDVRDSEIEDLARLASTSQSERLAHELARYLTPKKTNRLISKLRSLAPEMAPTGVPALATCIAELAHKIPSEPQKLFEIDAFSEAAIVVSHLIERLEAGEQRLALARKLVTVAEPFTFGSACLTWLRVTDREEEETQNVLSPDEFAIARGDFVDRVKKLAAEGCHLFDDKRSQVSVFLHWAIVEGRDPVQAHLVGVFKSEPRAVLKLVRAFAPNSWGEHDLVPRPGRFRIDQLEGIAEIIDPVILGNFVREARQGAESELEQGMADDFVSVCERWKERSAGRDEPGVEKG